jgi:peptidoglycan/xylan/chitin deacetylase (PgdA/CDA1 family)
MKSVGFVYHDVVANGHEDASGFAGRAPARYKLSWPQFEEHLEAIAAAGRAPTLIGDVQAHCEAPAPIFLTFDDGGASSVEVGERLADRGWRAYFFVISDRIGRPSFLDGEGIRALRDAGHAIGSHSRTHPERMSQCPWPELVDEWQRSSDRLGEILQEQIQVASVPGGFYSVEVAKAAAAAGIRVLFTSEPRIRSWSVDACLVLGRYSITRATPAATARRLAEGSVAPRMLQATSWSAKKVAKRLPGDPYSKLRNAILQRR